MSFIWKITNNQVGEIIELSSFDEIYEYIAIKEEFVLDLETSAKKEYLDYSEAGRDPYTSNISMLQIGDSFIQYAIDVREFPKETIKQLLLAIKEKNIRLIGHNIKFDLKMIYHHFGVIFENIKDTMLDEMILNTGLKVKFSLEALCNRYLNIKYAKTNQLDLFGNNEFVGLLSKDTRKQFIRLLDKPFTKEQLIYGLKDVEHTSRICAIQDKRIREDNLTVVSRLEHKFLLVLVSMELNGFYLDSELWTQQYLNNKKLLEESYSNIVKYIQENNINQFLDFQLTLFADTESIDHVNINLASSKQVIELCKVLGIPTQVLDKTKKKANPQDEDIFKDSVEESHLKKYKDQFPIIPMYLKYRKYLKATSTYGIEFLRKHVNPVTNRVHSSFWQIVDSGRISSRYPEVNWGSKSVWIDWKPFR